VRRGGRGSGRLQWRVWRLAHDVPGPDARSRVCRSEEIREVVGRMRRYRGNVVVQEQAAKMLRSLAEMSERNKAGVREQGGVADLVEAMRLHQDHAGLQKEACGALGSMARLNEKNKEAIARASAIPLVIAAMRSHPAALEQACWAIRNLAGAL
jgi:hypothetical protein